LYLSVLHFQGHSIGTRPLLFLGVLLIISGLQIGFFGLIADLIVSLSHKNSPPHFLLKYASDEVSKKFVK